MPWFRRTTVCACLAALLVADSSATVVVSMSFDDLITNADTVFRGEVVALQPRWIASPSDRAIVTKVVFKVDRVFKGARASQIDLDFLGGTIGASTFRVDGSPRFVVGDRAVLCVNRDRPYVSPLVGFMQGRFPIRRDAARGRDVVTTYSGAPLLRVADVGSPPRLDVALDVDDAMSLDDFERAVQTRAAEIVR